MQGESSKRVAVIDDQDDTMSSMHSKRARSEMEDESDYSEEVISDEEGPEIELANLDDFMAIKAITDEQMYSVFPEFEAARKINSEGYRYPPISEKTAAMLKKTQCRLRPASGKTLADLQRTSVHLFNKSVQQSIYNKKQAHRILQPVVNRMDQSFRHIYFPGVNKASVFSPEIPMLVERKKRRRQRQFKKLVDAIEDYIPVSEELENYKKESEELSVKMENIQAALRDHPSYVPPKVDTNDYSQSLFLFNSSTLFS